MEVHNEKMKNDNFGKSVVLGDYVKVEICDLFADKVMLAAYGLVRRKSDFRWFRMYVRLLN